MPEENLVVNPFSPTPPVLYSGYIPSQKQQNQSNQTVATEELDTMSNLIHILVEVKMSTSAAPKPL